MNSLFSCPRCGIATFLGSLLGACNCYANPYNSQTYQSMFGQQAMAQQYQNAMYQDYLNRQKTSRKESIPQIEHGITIEGELCE